MDIFCLQETHLKVAEGKYLRGLFKSSLFHAPETTKSKGVLIWISNKIIWESRLFLKDEKDSFVLLKGEMEGETWGAILR